MIELDDLEAICAWTVGLDLQIGGPGLLDRDQQRQLPPPA